MYAECLQLMNKTYEAIDQLEMIKRDMETLVIYEDNLLYIHVCNQLGNCYFKINNFD